MILKLLERSTNHPSDVYFFGKDDQHTSFAELWRRSGSAARSLCQYPRGARIAGLLASDADMVACFVGCLRADLDFVSLPLRSRGQSELAYAEQLQTFLRVVEAELLIVSGQDELLIRSTGIDRVIKVTSAAECVNGGRSASAVGERAGEGRLIQLTSGTTRTPKGVCLDGGRLAACIEATVDLIVPDGRYVGCYWVPLSHDMGLIGGLLCGWVAACSERLGRSRATYVCLSPERFLARPLSWLEACSKFGATVTAAPTFAFELVRRQLSRRPAALDLSSLQACVVGAEPVYPDVLRGFAAELQPYGLREEAVCPAYGLAEAVLTVSMTKPGEGWYSELLSDPEAGLGGAKREVVSCGPPVSCIDVRTRDPAGGKLELRGLSVAEEFLPRRTKQLEDGWLDTGDLGYVVDGNVFVVGRSDDLIFLAGRNVFAWELEREVAKESAVRPGNCVVVPDRHGRYVALFEASSQDPPLQELEGAFDGIRRRLVRAVGIGPSSISCVPRGSLPKTPSGKLKRPQIATACQQFLEAGLRSRSYVS